MLCRLHLLLIVGIITLTGISGIVGCNRPESGSGGEFDVAIVSIVEIEPIVELREGFREVFEASEFAQERNVKFEEFNAQGDAGLINQIADQIVTEEPDLVYVLGTPAAQAIQQRAPDVLLLQGAATDPVAAGLAESWEGSGRRYIATSDLPPIEQQLELIKELTPEARRIGIIYNPGEVNSVSVIQRLREQLKQGIFDFELVERPIANSSEVATAVQSLLGNMDVIYVPPDNTAHAAIPVIGQFVRENNIPFYATVSTALDEGALATLSLDFDELGRESARLALAVLEGADPATMPIAITQTPDVFINTDVAQDLKLDLESFRGRPNVTLVE